ncbi:MAG: leucine--tRNA ligase [Gemmatimonadetes bacterium]|nr:leucine--tRNA ligase [Gemmatimonadota bacterium]MCB9504669.1 leucine--tRNA ligase [Gemmatimonadales bacterium]MCA9763252.1 leucine--tRNA ligase [Gemmatimonadota bacterium]MCA9767364.1 leucine--tRNA ligase [Gemmatimonadota bacterium]HPF61069.1 leucine--tRNA ligase [Gemmatimonadales bacterium]
MADPTDTTAYLPAAVEAKWQARWRERRTNEPDLDGATNPFYNLMMFPYPSAEGLHVGNLFAFTGADVFGRFKRMQGYQVFEPIGFDAFGIHSENFAIKTGQHPAQLIPSNIRNFTRQLTRVGGMFSWEHVLSTTDRDYYRWTQWVFLQLHKRGLAYKKKGAVNWCPNDKTVLANEQVIAGACERCGAMVEQRVLEQWYFRITDYAQRLLENLDDPTKMDWSESTVLAQKNWIGRSEGADITFDVVGLDERITVYTTRPDTLFGATFMVLAPEHPLVERLTTPAQREAVTAYRAAAAAKDLVARKTGDKEKTGVATGGHVVNPATGEQIPVWIADYVLMDYGTGAIMAVPGHDERDFAFATKFGLPIVRVVAPAGGEADAPLEEAYVDNVAGVLVNSGAFDGLAVPEAKARVTAWLAEQGHGAVKVQYRLYDWCISRQRYWGPPIPIVYCDACGTVPVPEDQLPVELPAIDDFRPDDSGVSPLARHAEWYFVPCPACGGQARRETDVSDTFLDSAWYFLRYPSSEREDVAFDPARTRRWLPVASYIGGNEHAVLHLLYSRFITMVLHDAGMLDFEEPFRRFRAHGLIVKDGAKMSKSRGNVVVPDEYIEKWGADTFRTYLMFLGPFQEGGDFRDAGISGPRRFLDKVWELVGEATHPDAEDGEIRHEVLVKWHQTKQRVGEGIEALHYNTAIAALMEFLNALRDCNCSNPDVVAELVQMIAPFAPHFAEECWERLGHDGSVFDSTWPTWDPALTLEDTVTVGVQVGGKTRGTVTIARDATAEAAEAAARAEESVARHLEGKTVRKVIWVPGRLVNFVV